MAFPRRAALAVMAIMLVSLSELFGFQQPATNVHVNASIVASGTANIWVDTNGGGCSRSGSPTTYVDANGCGSIDAANDIAQNGDTIIVKGGTYGAQSITGGNSRTTRATMTIATGETMTVNGNLSIAGVSFLTLDGGGSLFGSGSRLVTSLIGAGAVPTSQHQATITGSNEVTLQGADFGGWGVWGSTNVTWKYNDIGPCNNYDFLDESGTSCNNGKVTNCTVNFVAGDCPASERNTGHVIEGNFLHDFGCDFSFYNGTGIEPGDTCHWECMYVSYADNLQVKRNWFRNCANGGDMFLTFSNGNGTFTAGHGHRNFVIENNVFESACSNNLGVPPYFTTEQQYITASGAAGNGCGGRNGASSGWGHCNIFGGASGDLENVKVRFNTFIGGTHMGHDGECTTNGYELYGNIMNWGPDCGGSLHVPPPTVTRNLVYGAFGCGTNATVVADLNAVITNNNAGSGDGTLLNGTTSADNLVPTSTLSGCPATDILGVPRPQDSGFCDAGAYEFDD